MASTARYRNCIGVRGRTGHRNRDVSTVHGVRRRRDQRPGAGRRRPGGGGRRVRHRPNALIVPFLADAERLPTIDAGAFAFRMLGPGDVEDLFAIFGDPEVMRYWSHS